MLKISYFFPIILSAYLLGGLPAAQASWYMQAPVAHPPVTSPIISHTPTPTPTPAPTLTRPPLTAPSSSLSPAIAALEAKVSPTLTPQEQQMYTAINQFRSVMGAPPLQLNVGLTLAAKIKSMDMLTKNYIAHVSPTFGYTFTLEKNLGLQAGGAENLAGSSSIPMAMAQLEADPGHRNNLLGNYTQVGVGVANTTWGVVVTQLFQ